MKTNLRLVLMLCGLVVPIVAIFLLAAPAVVGGPAPLIPPPEGDLQPTIPNAPPPQDTLSPNQPAQGPVIFPPDPGWPPYAQREITVRPEPPILNQPTEICAWVVNTTDVTQTVTLDFGVANFGIGLLFDPIGKRTIDVPPFAQVKACVIWIPRQPGHWCIEVILRQDGSLDQKSQRNIDVWESLVPGELADTVFPVRNPLIENGLVQMKAVGSRPGWAVTITPEFLPLQGGETQPVTLTVVPPRGVPLGSRQPIVDVEAHIQPAGQPTQTLIGGFRKMDWPPVPLHRLHDPPYAESEISVEPYPPRAGEPTEICVELRNLSNEPQTVEVGFEIAGFGIGLPFTPIDQRLVTIPPHGIIKVCTMWVPPEAGHFCVQIRLHDPRGIYEDQFSQRNLDVDEILEPGVPAPRIFEIRNPLPITSTIYVTTTRVDSFFDVFLDRTMLYDVEPGGIRPVVLTVVPKPGPMPEDWTPVVDVEAYRYQGPNELTLIGGIRKIFRPPIPIHRPGEPPYSESEISVRPYPPRAGEPVVICTELRNPTNVTQTVHVEFGIANFGIGLPFVPIDMQVVEIPPHGKVRVCTAWVPPIGGHFCAQIIIRQPGYKDVFSQRNMDVAEFLRPGEPDVYAFPVGNPFNYPVTITLGLVEHLPGWQVQLSTYELRNVLPDTHRVVTMTVTPDSSIADLDAGAPVVDVEAYVDHRLIGGFRKEFHPPIPIHRPDDPPYAEREISIEPYPPRAGEPTEICVELRNPTDFPQTIWVEFAWANFGIGLPWHPFHGQLVTLPPHSLIKKCTWWVPPFPGHFCAQVSLIDPDQRYRVIRSQRNIDVGEVFKPGEWTEPFIFHVGNPFTQPTDIRLVTLVHLEGWQAQVDPPVLYNVPDGAARAVTLTVRPPLGVPFPRDDTPIVDVEGYAMGQLIGGFRKIFRPPVPIHRPQDPIYAESEIHITPYPPRERQPTEICVEVRNPTNMTQTFTVTFGVANFGIGLPFHDIVRPIPVTLPPNSFKMVCVTWVPPFGGHFCAQVTIQAGDHEPVWSQRNMDVGEIFIPGQPSVFRFPVHNPTTRTVTVTLGMVPHVENWGLELSQDVLPNMQPGATRPVTLTVIPPVGRPFPLPDEPVVDVEGFIGRELIGGFRKLFHPPVPVHVPKDPPYAESEIFIDPYPTRVGLPTLLGAVVYNPTPFTQRVTVTFGVAHFGIGMPFTQTGIVSPTLVVNVPPMGMARAKTLWMPQFNGHVCVQIQLQSAGHGPVWSQRNIDVGEPLRLGVPHSRIIEIRNPMTEAMTITLALINHRPEWQVTLVPTMFVSIGSGVVKTATLTVRPPNPSTDPQEREEQLKELADERPIADVEAYINGELIGGIRKIAKPPIPLHKPQDRPYAESEIAVTPYPLLAGQPATITTQIMNTSEETQTIRVEFRVANFGMGIPFTDTNIMPTYRVVTLGPGISTTVGTVWTPPFAGNWCIQITLRDPNNQYPPQHSQRNVVVERRPANSCEPIVRDFWLQNSTGLAVTVTLGSSAINLPPGWTYSTNITETVLGPYQGITVTLTITPPCGLAALDWVTTQSTLETGASGLAEVNVEGYIEGELMPESGGIQVQIEIAPPEYKIYMPLVLRN